IPLTTPSSFIYLLRWSYYRPRDILTLLSILQENLKNSSEKTQITFSDIEDANFKRKYSNYLLGEVKDQLSFYYTLDDYELFLKF
ncbi:hypothetical protein ABTH37_18970, partial [Acinetobacter baumannii]